MSVHFFHRKFVRSCRKLGWNPSSGFTLLELLISLIIGSIVITGLLTVIVDLLRVDRREIVLEQTQRDMERALAYISDDIRESVYIYSNPSVVAAQLTDLPAGTTPILAFWRPDPIESGIPNCSTIGTALENQCNVLELRQAAYSLVVYLQRDDNPADNTWVGPSQILRYELDRYSNLTTLTQTPGYRDPSDPDSSFSGWTASGNTSGTFPVLVDLVDSPNTVLNRSPLSDAPVCSSYGPDYSVVPSTATTATNTSFFACVRDPAGSSNQDVYVFLRGNVDNLLDVGSGAFNADGNQPTLEVRTRAGGVLDKNPVN